MALDQAGQAVSRRREGAAQADAAAIGVEVERARLDRGGLRPGVAHVTSTSQPEAGWLCSAPCFPTRLTLTQGEASGYMQGIYRRRTGQAERFPDGAVKISNFSNLEGSATARVALRGRRGAAKITA